MLLFRRKLKYKEEKMGEIENILWDKTTYNLSYLCGVADLKKYGNKGEIVERLSKLYDNENFVRDIFDSLSEYEKAYITCVVQNKYHPREFQINEIKKQFEVIEKTEYSTRYGEDFSNNSKLNLLFIKSGKIPQVIKEKLEEIIKPLEFEVEETKDSVDPEEFYSNIKEREKRVEDFDEFIKFINTNNIKPTKAKQELPKSNVIKLHKILGYRDLLRNDELDFETIKNIGDTTVTYGIMKLLENASIIKVKKDKFIIDEENCAKYQKLNKVEKIKYLLEKYEKPEKSCINEGERILCVKLKFDKKENLLGKAREKIINYLKKCPVGKWIDMQDFKNQIAIHEYRFLRKYVSEVLIRDEYYMSYYQTPSHDEFETPFLDIVFMEYLATLGIIDVTISDYWTDYGDRKFFEVEYFRITKLGAYVLGLEKFEEEKNVAKQDIVVNNKFEIEVKNQKLKYELYFDRFLSKKSKEPLVYKLDFKGMVKALEIGIKIKDIYEYIKENNKEELPKNVKAQFEDWIYASKRIKIKNVTILEIDDENFYEIMRNEDYKPCIDSVRDKVIILKNNKTDEIKKILNKNGKFCIYN